MENIPQIHFNPVFTSQRHEVWLASFDGDYPAICIALEEPTAKYVTDETGVTRLVLHSDACYAISTIDFKDWYGPEGFEQLLTLGLIDKNELPVSKKPTAWVRVWLELPYTKDKWLLHMDWEKLEPNVWETVL